MVNGNIDTDFVAVDNELLSSLLNQIAFRALTIKERQERLDSLCMDAGKLLYPDTLGKRLVLFLDVKNVNWELIYKCVGYESDINGDVVMTLLDLDSNRFAYRACDRLQYKKIENGRRNNSNI